MQQKTKNKKGPKQIRDVLEERLKDKEAVKEYSEIHYENKGILIKIK